MSLKELKRLAPWGWESKIATKKHKIGPKGLQEWEQIQRAIVGCDLDDDGPSSGGGRDKFGGSKRLRSKDGLHPAAAPPNPEVIMELTTPGHTTTNKKTILLLAPLSNSSAAAGEAASDSSLGHVSSCKSLPKTPAPPAAVSDSLLDASQPPCADPCPSTAVKPAGAGSLSVARTPAAAASAAKTPAAVRSGVPETPAGAILSKAFGTSPYAPTPVPYRGAAAGKQLTGSISAAAAAAAHGDEPRRTRAQSHADGSAAAAAAGTGSRHSSSGSGPGAAAAPGSMSSRRSSGRSAGAMAGTPVPRFSLTSPSAMLPPVGRTLGGATGAGSGPYQHQQATAMAAATATPAQPAGRACSAGGSGGVLTPATAPRSAHSAAQGSGGPLSRSLSTPHSRGSAAACAGTPSGLPGMLPNLLDLLAAASAGVEPCSPEGPAGQEAQLEYGPEGAAFSLECLAATAAEAAAANLQQQCSGGIDSDQLMVDADSLMPGSAAAAAGADDDSTPQDTTPAGQQDLPAAALATPGPQVIKALSGAAAAAGIAAAPGSGGAAGASAEAGGASGSAHSGDSAGSVGGCRGSSSGGNTRAVSAMRLKKLWRESHAAAMAAAAAATAAKPDSPAAAEAGEAAVPAATPTEPRVLDLSDAEMAATATAKGDQGTADRMTRAHSPDSLAVACSADLLLLAAAAEEEGAAWAEADVAAAAASAAAEQAQAAHAAREAAAGSIPAAAPAADAATAQGGKAPGLKARRSGSNSSSGGGPQTPAVAAARAAVSAALPRQPHAAPSAPQRRHHTDSMTALPVRTAHVPAPAAAAGAPAPAAAAVTGDTTLALSNCTSSLMLPPAAQVRLMQLQQKHVGPGGAPIAPPAVCNPVSRFHPVAANTRLHHVHTAGQMPPPRTSHTGVTLQQQPQLQPHPGHGLAVMGLGSPVAAAAGGAGPLSPVAPLLPVAPWSGAPAAGILQQQQLHSVVRCGAEKGKGVQGKGVGAAPAAAAAPRAAAAALDSLCTNGGSSSGALGAPVLEIAPLVMPTLLSDADSWRLAQSQPWLIEAVAAEARQLLLGASVAAAAAMTASAAPAAANVANSSLGGVVRAAALPVQCGQAGAVGVPHGCSGVRGPSVGGSAAGGDRVAAASKQQQQQQGHVLRTRVLQARN